MSITIIDLFKTFEVKEYYRDVYTLLSDPFNLMYKFIEKVSVIMQIGKGVLFRQLLEPPAYQRILYKGCGVSGKDLQKRKVMVIVALLPLPVYKLDNAYLRPPDHNGGADDAPGPAPKPMVNAIIKLRVFHYILADVRLSPPVCGARYAARLR